MIDMFNELQERCGLSDNVVKSKEEDGDRHFARFLKHLKTLQSSYPHLAPCSTETIEYRMIMSWTVSQI
jgi:hypothetical protein